jgi:hypothetical protein
MEAAAIPQVATISAAAERMVASHG